MELNVCARRFWAKVDKGGDAHPYVPHLGACWRWTGAIGSGGYGNFALPGYGPTMKAHRVAWLLTHGSLPDVGLVVRHNCDRRWCVNPAHLESGTVRDNHMDALTRNRRVWGEAITYCPQGHEYTPCNTYVTPTGRRHCKTCRRAADKARRR